MYRINHHERLRFNPRVREGRDKITMWVNLTNYVSIVKDATAPVPWNPLNPAVSIHASVKDATATPSWLARDMTVSIHASVKDATV